MFKKKKQFTDEEIEKVAPDPQLPKIPPVQQPSFPRYPEAAPQQYPQYTQGIPQPQPQPIEPEDDNIGEEIYQIEAALLRLKYKLGLR